MAAPLALESLDGEKRYTCQTDTPRPDGLCPAMDEKGRQLLWQPLPAIREPEAAWRPRLLSLTQQTGLRPELIWQPLDITAPPQPGLVYPPLPPGFLWPSATPLAGQPRRAARFFADGQAGQQVEMSKRLSIARELCQAVAQLQALGWSHPALAASALLDTADGHCRLGGLELVDLPGLPLANGHRQPPGRYTAPCRSDNSAAGTALSGDLYALTVLLYDILLPPSAAAPEQQASLNTATMTIAVEKAFGQELAILFAQAWGEGMRDTLRCPRPEEWLTALNRLEDVLTPCGNADCACRWAALQPQKTTVCPGCGQEVKGVLLHIHTALPHYDGHWLADRRVLAVSPGQPLKSGALTADDNAKAGQVLAYVFQEDNAWYLVDAALPDARPLGGGQPQPLYRVDEELALLLPTVGGSLLLTGEAAAEG